MEPTMREFFSADRRVFYSFTLLAFGLVTALAGHVEVGILNALGAIWMKMDYPRD
jgi:hypothetical protein